VAIEISVDWFAFSIAGAASLAVTGIIDKFYLGRYVHNVLSYLFVLVVIQQIFLLPVLAYAGLDFVYPQSFYALAIGVVQVILWAAYLRALSVEETSRIAGQVYVFPVFVFLGEFFLLGQTLRYTDYVGGALLVLAALLISYRPASNHGRIAGGSRISPALKYMAVFWIFTAAYSLASKYLLDYMIEWHLIIWSSLGSLIAVLALLVRGDIRREIRGYARSGPRVFSILLLNEFFDFLGRGAFIFAYAQGSVALVSSVSALQPFITLIYVLILGCLFPGLLVEDSKGRTIVMKVAATVLIVAGVYLVS